MKLGTVTVDGAQRVAVAVGGAGERAVVLYSGPDRAGPDRGLGGGQGGRRAGGH